MNIQNIDFLQKNGWKIFWGISLVSLILCYKWYRGERMDNYRSELSALSVKRKRTKAFVYSRNKKFHELRYRFTLEGIEYTGNSNYSFAKQQYIEKEDSIWVYYKEDDPNVNLWVGMFE